MSAARARGTRRRMACATVVLPEPVPPAMPMKTGRTVRWPDGPAWAVETAKAWAHLLLAVYHGAAAPIPCRPTREPGGRA